MRMPIASMFFFHSSVHLAIPRLGQRAAHDGERRAVGAARGTRRCPGRLQPKRSSRAFAPAGS